MLKEIFGCLKLEDDYEQGYSNELDLDKNFIKLEAVLRWASVLYQSHFA